MDNSNLKDELPEFFGWEKKNIYRVPDLFFEKLEEGIQREIVNKNKTTPKKTKRWIEVSIAAAIVSVVCFSGIQLMKDPGSVNGKEGLILYNLFYCDLE